VTGTSPKYQQANSSDTAEVGIDEIRIEITSPKQSDPPASVVTLAGTVNDLSISKVMITMFGALFSADIIQGQFSHPIPLSPGENIITVQSLKLKVSPSV